MYKFGSIEEAAKAHASGQFNKVSPPPTAEKKSSRRGAIGAKTVEDVTAKQKVTLKRSETTLERKRRTAPPPPPSAEALSPTQVHKPKIKKLVVALPITEERLPILPELSTTPTEIAKAADPSFDTFQRLKSFDGETLRNAIITKLPLKTQLDIVQAYYDYSKITSAVASDKLSSSTGYEIPSTIY